MDTENLREQMLDELLDSQEGYRTYQRTLLVVLIRSIHKVLGEDCKVKVVHGIPGGTYCEIRRDGMHGISQVEADQILAQMKAYIKKSLPIDRREYPLEYAMDLFEKKHMEDKEDVFKYRRFNVVNLTTFDGEVDYFFGTLLKDTSWLTRFGLVPYQEGLVLLEPKRRGPHEVKTFEPSEKLFDVYCRSGEWGKILGVETVGDLNDRIARGNQPGGINELVQVSEALHAGHIASIAKEIHRRKDVSRIVLIAGPSSSGKTTFAKKLSIQLKAEGLNPHMISVDDYFLDRDETPLGPDGKPDFENLSAINIREFNQDLTDLLAGKEVHIPRFDFVTGTGKRRKEGLKIGAEDILVIEGIHCMNEELTPYIPREEKFKIYISALTFINIDDHNRIPATDARLLRRMVRDNLYRGTSAAGTIDRWPSVRAGEDKNIFPYQEDADVMFNSAHIYELAVLKLFAEPLLFAIDRKQPEYAESRRLIKFLDYCLSLSPEIVPDTSIIREFIGGSTFEA